MRTAGSRPWNLLKRTTTLRASGKIKTFHVPVNFDHNLNLEVRGREPRLSPQFKCSPNAVSQARIPRPRAHGLGAVSAEAALLVAQWWQAPLLGGGG